MIAAARSFVIRQSNNKDINNILFSFDRKIYYVFGE